jgi:ectoine hydroxylase-related dioxygenase (phytanoyl-CoA dioxygenase family)
MDRQDDRQVSPVRTEAGATTAPMLTAADEIAQLKQEVARLKAQLAATAPPAGGKVNSGNSGDIGDNGEWPRELTYGQQPYSGARLGGITRQRERIRNTSEFPELPRPTRHQPQLEADLIRWGYCLVADALSPAQTQAQVERLLDQAAAERAAGVASMSHRGAAQFVPNLIPKGQVFRDLIALEPHAADAGPLVEDILKRMLGKGWYLCTAHGSVVHQHGGLQELHQDQGFVPLPHPPFPLYGLIIWCYTDFDLDNGGTYIVPGSHRDAAGNNLVRPEVEYERLADGRLLAIAAPAGTCIITDSRVLHSGGKRTAPGTRLASRILYGRGFVRQQENQLACIPDALLEQLSPKLLGLIGFKPHQGLGMVEGNSIDPRKPRTVVGELSMSRRQEFAADFDWRHTELAKASAQQPGNHADYRGPE